MRFEDLHEMINIIEQSMIFEQLSLGINHLNIFEIDDEIIEIFLEEAEEEYANIQRLLPQWEANL